MSSFLFLGVEDGLVIKVPTSDGDLYVTFKVGRMNPYMCNAIYFMS